MKNGKKTRRVTLEVKGRGDFQPQHQERIAPCVSSSAYEQNTFVLIEYI